MSLGTMGPTRDIGPAIVVWGATTISEIFEEVKLTLTGADPAEVFEAVHGATPVDSILTGYSECSVTVPATRVLLSTLALLLPGGSRSGVTNTGVVLQPALTVGLSMWDNGRPLFIEPVVAGIAADNGQWLRLERTYPIPNFDVTFDLKTQRVYGVTFKAHPNTGAAIGSEILWSAGMVNAAATY